MVCALKHGSAWVAFDGMAKGSSSLSAWKPGGWLSCVDFTLLIWGTQGHWGRYSHENQLLS